MAFKMNGFPMVDGSSPVKWGRAKRIWKLIQNLTKKSPPKRYGDRGQYSRIEDMRAADKKYMQGSGSN